MKPTNLGAIVTNSKTENHSVARSIFVYLKELTATRKYVSRSSQIAMFS